MKTLLKKILKPLKNFQCTKVKKEHWFEYRKCLITASKAHEVVTKITKVKRGGGGTVNIGSLN